jgi:Ca2+-transporting ATPase
VTVSFATLALAQLAHVFNLRDAGSSARDNDIVANPWIWGATALCTALVVAAVHLPGLSAVLGTTSPGAGGWGVIAGMSLAPLLLGQVWRTISR